MKCLRYIIILIVCCCVTAFLAAQNKRPVFIRSLNVADGLPQSFVSGLVQDSTGFIWIGTRDGLARYDGKEFRIFRHIPGDSSTLSDNVIRALYIDRAGYLWVMYESGDIDLLHTATGQLVHLTNDPLFRPLYNQLRDGNAVAEDARGNIWLFGSGQKIHVCNPARHSLVTYDYKDFGFAPNSVSGLTAMNGRIVALTDTALVEIDENKASHIVAAYDFSNPHLAAPWKNVPVVFRKNGDMVIKDEDRIIIYSPHTKQFTVVGIPKWKGEFSFLMTCDAADQVYFERNRITYILAADNTLSVWQTENENSRYGLKSILADHSGVLWTGGNGSGLQMYDLRLTRLPASRYDENYAKDMLHHYFGVPVSDFKKTFFSGLDAFQFRWTKGPDGKHWFCIATNYDAQAPVVCYMENGRLYQQTWQYTDASYPAHGYVNAMAFSSSGKLWGVDFNLRLSYFDVQSHTATVYPPVGDIALTNAHAVSSLWIEGEDDFWISTVQNGLYHYNRRSGQTTHYTAGYGKGRLPTNLLMNIIPDPRDKNILWIGSLDGGLLRFDKSAGLFRNFTTKDGLPNNTVYAVLPDASGILWCSSNKGIFSFDPTKGLLRSFSVQDGLPGDEFNRYHFFELPDGRLSFGGVDGYTVFDPLKISGDDFEPQTALTGIRINNVPANFGDEGSPFTAAINSLGRISLPYYQNFITFSFAALEYNIPDKIQYRYMLEGYNTGWVYSGRDNFASYTNLPPGKYTFNVNATNTAGKWSSHIRSMPVIIFPPFWQTWWFMSVCIIAAIALIYFIIRYRFNEIIKKERQKAEFEKQSAELKAQAMRAQMNPHFIFNCMNSIKVLIQEDKRKEAVIYLTTFARLIRNQLSNSEQVISLHDELETCRLYTQLEALRFGADILCRFDIDRDIDLHSINVPPLIIQPFIENAIWHGLLPKGYGEVAIKVQRSGDAVECRIDDNGIGREMAMHNKSQSSSTYESKGMKLVRGRLSLYNNITGNNDSVELIDKKDEAGNASGTLVIITFKEQA